MGVNKVHIVHLLNFKELKIKINTSLYLVVQSWTQIRKKEEEEVYLLYLGVGVIGTRIHIPCTLISNRQQL